MPNDKTTVSGAPSEAAQGSVPENNQKATGQQVDTAPKQDSQESNQAPKAGILKDLSNLRGERRELRTANDNLQTKFESSEAKIAELQAKLDKTSKAVEEISPSEATPNVVQPNIEEIVDRRMNAHIAQQTLASDVQSAEDWLLSQSHFKKNPKGLDEVQTIIKNDGSLLNMVSQFPQFAAEEANRRWLDSKGLKSGVEAGNSATSSSRSSGGVPSVPSGADARTWSKSQIAGYLKEHPVGSPEFTKRMREMEKVQKEGRVQG